jgi:hypothetical protein
MRFLWSTHTEALRPAPVKSPGALADVPVAVRPVSGLPAARAPRVKRSRLAAYASASAAVVAQTPEVEYLRSRLAAYEATTPRDVTAPIPTMEVTDAAVFVIHHGDRRHPLDLVFDPPEGGAPQAIAPEVAFQNAAVEAARAGIARRVSELEEDVQTAERERRESNDEIAQLVAERTAASETRRHAIESGRIDLTPARVPSLIRIFLWRAWLIATVLGEWAAFFLATANMNGVDPTALEAEWAAGAAWAIIGSALTAATVAGGMFILAEWAAERLRAAITADATPERAFQLSTATVAMVYVALVLVTVAVMRSQLGTAGQIDSAAVLRYAILTSAPLLAAVCVQSRLGDLVAARTAARMRLGTPDRHGVVAELRKADEHGWIAERERLRAERNDSIAAILRLQASVAGGDQALRDVARFETSVVSIWCDAVKAAMARDKAAFRICARLLPKREHLLAKTEPTAGALIQMRRVRRTA